MFFPITCGEITLAGRHHPLWLTHGLPQTHHFLFTLQSRNFLDGPVQPLIATQETVTYLPWTTIHEWEGLDESLLDAPITTPNLPLLAIIKTLRAKYYNHPTLVSIC